jgi:hypothetical protein
LIHGELSHMLSLDVCRRCDDDDSASVGAGSGADLSAGSDLEAVFCAAVSGVKGGYVIKGCAVCAYGRCQVEGELGLEHDEQPLYRPERRDSNGMGERVCDVVCGVCGISATMVGGRSRAVAAST